jgi:hypothetical protein
VIERHIFLARLGWTAPLATEVERTTRESFAFIQANVNGHLGKVHVAV